MSPTTIPLAPERFGPAPTEIARTDTLTVTAFRYPSGTAALTIRTPQGLVTMLPFQGQQIWDVNFLGRSLRMGAMIDMPRPEVDFLRTYGAFLLHCGATAAGPPGPDDTHPAHGELPNARFDTAALVFDDHGVSVTGSYRHTVAFQTDYLFRPEVRIEPGRTTLDVSVNIENRKTTSMELFYLAHINFRPEEGMQLIDNATGIRLREDLPAHMAGSPRTAALMDRLRADPDLHRRLSASDGHDPETVMFLDFDAGQPECLALHSDGTGDVVRYDRATLPRALRWISWTPDQACLGLVLPATCESEGRTRDREKGHVTHLAGGATWRCGYEIGCLDKGETAILRDRLT